jgi:hypothetical protein
MNPLILSAVVYGGKKIAEKATPSMIKEGSKLVFQFVKDASSIASTKSKKKLILSEKL